MRTPRPPLPPGNPQSRQLWRLVDGAVRSAFAAHPDYLANKRMEKTVRNSIVKRVTGTIIGYVEEVANSSARTRSESISAGEMVGRITTRFTSGSVLSEPGGGAELRRPEISEAPI